MASCKGFPAEAKEDNSARTFAKKNLFNPSTI